ncbi:hypothetical protein [Alkalihalobacillus sp. TS-13]|uniref:hypothetical protein n=1 Tax=Alkalihalobacillus sp. TS-13 TaxID=2842455 RepID=UPI001C878522|nr:hypothetical protein [Alkalihalobacillus sp. TS-13]
MNHIGFEVLAMMALPILPGHTYSICILWDEQRLSSSIGKDVYHQGGLILPGRRITATGRIHHQSADTTGFAQMESAGSHLGSCPSSQPETIQVQLTLPKGVSLFPIDRSIGLHFIIEESQNRKVIPLFLDYQSVQEVETGCLHFDLSLILPKHMDQTNNGVTK